jgi:hypothetical protein|tara:strand:- start:113 stop:253 length:141 start_codon:yes stop_codon:yes gene_type:complete
MLICDLCGCEDTEENPVLEIVDEEFGTVEHICMMCLVEQLDEEKYA